MRSSQKTKYNIQQYFHAYIKHNEFLHFHQLFRSPRAEMHMKIYISPSREYDPESTVPLAGMQSKFYIPASGDFVIISVHRPLERRCT